MCGGSTKEDVLLRGFSRSSLLLDLMNLVVFSPKIDDSVIQVLH